MDTVAKTSLAIFALSASVLCLSFGVPILVEQPSQPLEGWIWTVVGLLLIPLMIVGTLRIFKSLLR